jgi:hypothetical protein
MRIRPVEQVINRYAVADERAPALLLRVQAAKPLIARLPQRDPIGRSASARPEVAQVGGEDDECRAVVASLTRARERDLQRAQDGGIGTRMRQRVSAAGRLGSGCSRLAVAPLVPIDPVDAIALGSLEQQKLAFAIEIDVLRRTRQARRMRRGSPPNLRQDSVAAMLVDGALFLIGRGRDISLIWFSTLAGCKGEVPNTSPITPPRFRGSTETIV